MIFNSNAVINPLAMMIKTFNTLITNVAVTRVRGADHFAMGTKQVSFEFFDKANEGYG